MMSSIALLSNVTTGILEQELSKRHSVFVPDGFDTWKFEIWNQDSRLYKESFDAIFFLLYVDAIADNWQTTDEAKAEMDQWVGLIRFLSMKLRKTPIFVSNMDIRRKKILPLSIKRCECECEVHWNDSIQELNREGNEVYIWDIQTLITDMGRNLFYSNKIWYMSNNPYSIKGIKEINKDMQYIINAVSRPRKKCLVLDMDNTLWGGVIGEDGIEGIELFPHKEGARFYDLQKRILEIKNSGVLLSILSKNNENEVWEVFDKHPHSILSRSDFVYSEINWESKAENIRRISKQLNIGLDSFVFIDDNPVEQEQMRQWNPEVTVVDFPQDTSQLENMIQQVYKEYFLTFDTTEEDRLKTKMYLQEGSRKVMRSQYQNMDDYLYNLGIEIEIHRMSKAEQERVTQLCNKTNQFNLTTKRYTLKNIQEIEQLDNIDIFTVYVRDKFGDSGLVAVLIVKVEPEPEIDSFLMSCRVMGRRIEKAIYVEVHNYYTEKNYQKIYATYIRTEKNKPVECLCENLGFGLVKKNGLDKQYEQPLVLLEQTKIFRKIEFSAKRL